MKMFKRLASVAVVLAMVMTMLPAVVSAGTLPNDVKGTKYEDAASLLCALDVMVGDGTNFNADNNVTRAEFAKILATAMGHLDAASAFAAQGVFTDVPTNEWYACFVEFAAQLGAINGYGDGKFGPNDNVTGYQAIKMICFASGHNACIEDPIGGYPQEYVNVAQEYDFLKNLSDVNLSLPMTRGQVAILTANVMKADMLRLIGTSQEDGNAYEIMEGVNLLSEKHDVYRFDGLVTATEKTGLFGVTTLSAGEVQIEKGADVIVLDAGESGIDKALGTYVKAYYKVDDDNGTETVVSFDASSAKNTKVALDYKDIDMDESDDSTIRYWKDGDQDAKTTKLTMSDEAAVIWNGSASSYTSVIEALEDAEGKQAKVEFLDYDGDNKIDIVSILAYETYVVGRIDSDNYILTDEMGDWSTGSKKTKSLTLDLEDDTVFVTITDVDDSEYEFEDIAVGDVLSVAESADGKVIDIKLSIDTIEGTVDSIGRVDGDLVFEIDGEDYKLTGAYFDYIAGGNDNAAIADLKVKIGKSYEFKVDVFGQIAYSDTAAGDAKGEFGFIIKYAEGEGADANLNVRLYSAGSIDNYGVANTVEIDGEKYKGAEVVTAMDTIIAKYIPAGLKQGGYFGDGKWYGVPVLFELNDDEQIKYIDTPVVGADEDKYTLQPTRNRASDSIFTSKYTSSAFGTSNPVSSSFSVIQLPSKDSDMTTASKYSTAKSFNTSTNYYVQLFSTDPESYTATYAIIANGANGSVETSFTKTITTGLNDPDTVSGGNDNAGVKTTPLFIVSEVYRAAAGEDDEETIMIKGMENGNEVTYTVDPEYYATGYILETLISYLPKGATISDKRTNQNPIMEGDVLRLARNKTTQYVTFVAPVFYMEEKAFYAYTDGGYLNNTGTVYGAIDISTVSEMDGTQGIMSYFIKSNKSAAYGGVFSIDADGRLVPPTEIEGATEGDTDTTDVFITEDGYEGTFTRMFNIGGFSKIALYDASKSSGKRVVKGSLNDIITLEDATNKTNPSLVIFHYRTGTNYSMIIINL